MDIDMKASLIYVFFCLMGLAGLSSERVVAQVKSEDGFVPLFNGINLDGWTRVNTAESTWSIKDQMLICSGKPIGELRTKRMYQNFILEVEWRHMVPRGNAGIFVWADDITAKGVPFHRSIEVQVLENAYGNGGGHTVHGDIFPIHGARMNPVNGRGGSRAFPVENRSKPSPEWNHYRIECQGGEVSLAVNGKVVTRGKQCSPRKGYICIESEGGVVHYRNMKIKVLPDTPVKKEDVAIADRGYKCLYEGVDLSGWQAKGAWSANDWRLRLQGENGVLTSDKAFVAKSFIVDFHSGDLMPTFEYGGATIDPSQFEKSTLAKGKGWNRLQCDLRDGKVYVQVNGKKAVDPVPGVASKSNLVVRSAKPCELANIYVKE